MRNQLLLESHEPVFMSLDHHLDEHPQLAVALRAATKWHHVAHPDKAYYQSM